MRALLHLRSAAAQSSEQPQLSSNRRKLGLHAAAWVVLVAAFMVWVRPTPHAQGSSRLPFTVNFNSGTVQTGWDGFRNDTGVALTTQGCLSGGCLRAPLVSGTHSDNYGDFYFGDHVGRGGTKVEEVWVRLWAKFDAGMRWPNRTQKLALLNLTDGVSSERRYQIMLDVNAQGQYFVERSDIATWRFTGHYQNVGAAAPVRVGEWDKLKLYVRLNTPNQNNGIARLWVNDQLKLEHTNINIRSGSSFGMNKFILTTYATEESPSNGVQWFDDVTVSLTDPDGASTLPTAPRNLRVVPTP